MTAGRPHTLVRTAAWASLIANIGIILTGGLVRLTGSGLGCDTWPRCSTESLTPTSESSGHAFIEFGNRTLTGVLLLIAFFALYAVYRKASNRADLKQLAWVQLGGILVQAMVGGGVVLLDLTWNAVGFHYLLSIVLVGAMAVFVHRAYSPPGARVMVAQSVTLKMTYLLALVTGVVLVLGVIATGSGPHSGDASEEILRSGFDAYLVYRIHAFASYTLLILTVGLLVRADSAGERPEFTRWVRILLLAEAFQIGVGITQATTSLPIGLVSIHMVFASVIGAIVVTIWQELRTTESKEPRDSAEPHVPGSGDVVPAV